MKTTLRWRFPTFLGFLVACFAAAPAQESVPPPAGNAGEASVPARSVAPRTLSPARQQLLDLAFAAASRFPLQPHGRNRSRAQELVVQACFDLGQPRLAVGYANRIQDWRRGPAWADYAFHCANAGDVPEAERYLQLATGVAAALRDDPNAQEWRRDLILLKVARARHALGDAAGAAEVAAGIAPESSFAVDDDWSRSVADRVGRLTPVAAEAEVAAIDAAFGGMSFGQQHAALATLVAVHACFFAREELRAVVERRLLEVYTKLPPTLRLDAIARLVDNHLRSSSRDGAGRLIAGMQAIVGQHQWRAEDELPQRARIAELLWRAGEQEAARAAAEAVWAAFPAAREGIVAIHRAEALRPLALAWHTMGEHERAEQALDVVLTESLVNPNSRPRCDDLVETCVALARRDWQPSAAVWQRLRAIERGLGEPW